MAAIEFSVRRLASDSASIQPALAPSTRASDLQALRAEEARQERRAQPGQQARQHPQGLRTLPPAQPLRQAIQYQRKKQQQAAR